MFMSFASSWYTIFKSKKKMPRLISALSRKHTRLNPIESESKQSNFSYHDCKRVKHTTQYIGVHQNLYIDLFLKSNKYKYGFPHILNKFIFQTLTRLT